MSTKPALHLERDSILGSVGLSPILLTGYFVQLMRALFLNPETSMMSPALRKSKYGYLEIDQTKQTANTGIRIESISKYNEAIAGKIPAILVARNQFALGKKLSIGDRYQTPSNLLGNGHDPNINATLGNNQQILQIDGGHIFYVIAGEAGMCEELATQVWFYLLDFKQVIRKDLTLSTFEINSLERMKKLKESGDKDNWVIPITVTYTYYRETVIYEESPVLKAISLAANNAENT